MANSLLRRIGSNERGSAPRSVSALESIAAHLSDLLNSRQGEAATNPGYGVVDFSSMVHSPNSAQLIAASIRSTILAFEPRLKNVSVRSLENNEPLVLRFEITAALAEKNSREILRFSTRILPGGHIELS